MKHRKSKTLVSAVAEIEKIHRGMGLTKREERSWEASMAKLRAEYPFNVREPVFCWLWVNHDEVALLRVGGLRWTWYGIAKAMQEEGVKGSRGEPPNPNSVRRVWGRVYLDVKRWTECKAALDGK